MSKPKRTTSKRKQVESRPIWERSGLAAMNAVARVDPTFPSDLIHRAIRDAYRKNGYPVPRFRSISKREWLKMIDPEG